MIKNKCYILFWHVDVDECNPSSDCMQKCINSEGSYNCSCNEFFKTDPSDWRKCVGELVFAERPHVIFYQASSNMQTVILCWLRHPKRTSDRAKQYICWKKSFCTIASYIFFSANMQWRQSSSWKRLLPPYRINTIKQRYLLMILLFPSLRS